MFAWLRDLNPRERRTMTACFAGWTLDGFDFQLYSHVVPTMMALWGLTAGAAGSIGMITLVTSSSGAGWPGRWPTGSGGCAFCRSRSCGTRFSPSCAAWRKTTTSSSFCALYTAWVSGASGRALGAFFPTMVGYAVVWMPLGTSIALFCGLSCLLMLIMLAILPETRGREIANLEARAGAGSA